MWFGYAKINWVLDEALLLTKAKVNDLPNVCTFERVDHSCVGMLYRILSPALCCIFPSSPTLARLLASYAMGHSRLHVYCQLYFSQKGMPSSYLWLSLWYVFSLCLIGDGGFTESWEGWPVISEVQCSFLLIFSFSLASHWPGWRWRKGHVHWHRGYL